MSSGAAPCGFPSFVGTMAEEISAAVANVRFRPLADIRIGVFTGAVWSTRPWARRATVWCLAYLWTAAAALTVSYAAHWQYDGDWGWWVVAVYSFPALALASPLNWLAGNSDRGATYCLIALAVLTIAASIALNRSARLPNVR